MSEAVDKIKAKMTVLDSPIGEASELLRITSEAHEEARVSLQMLRMEREALCTLLVTQLESEQG